MTQLTDFQRKVIVLFKEEHTTWGLSKCAEVLPNFFSKISKRQMDRVVAYLKREGSPVAGSRKEGSGRRRSLESPTREAVVTLAVTPPDKGRRHLSQRQIASELAISKGAVFNILKESSLKCYKRVKCQSLSEAHKESRKQKSQLLINRFQNHWQDVWFSDEATFMLQPPLNKQNERIYRSVTCKTDIAADDLLVEVDKQQTSVMCYGAMSWHGKTCLRFVEGYAEGQENLPAYRRKKKTVNKVTYTNEMLPGMFTDIQSVIVVLAARWCKSAHCQRNSSLVAAECTWIYRTRPVAR